MAHASPIEGEFDYIIVGAGSAGCVLANRLSEDPNNRVCLIEAGAADSHPFIHVPALVGAALGFLWFNSYPGQIFMGDVGSLSLGGSLGTLAVVTKSELLLPLIGGQLVDGFLGALPEAQVRQRLRISRIGFENQVPLSLRLCHLTLLLENNGRFALGYECLRPQRVACGRNG